MNFSNKIILILLFISLSIKTVPVFAALSTNIEKNILEGDGKNIFNPSLGDIFSKVIQTAIIIATLATFIMLIWGGIEWITSGGDKSKYEAARKRITAALIGLALTASAWAIWFLAMKFLGLDNMENLKIINGSGGSGGPNPNSCQWCYTQYQDPVQQGQCYGNCMANQ